MLSIKISLNVWSDFDKRWLDYLIILGKVDWLNGRHSIWSLAENFSAVFIVILFDFTNPKNSLLIILPTPSMGPFPWWALL